MLRYQLYKDIVTNEVLSYVKKIDDSGITFIPSDPNNSDWQAYQVWLADGNEPEAAE